MFLCYFLSRVLLTGIRQLRRSARDAQCNDATMTHLEGYADSYQESVNRFLGEVTGAAHHLKEASGVMHENVDTHMRRLMMWFMLLLTNVSLMGIVSSLLVSPKLLKLVRVVFPDYQERK